MIFFFNDKNQKKGDKLLLLKDFHNFDVKCTFLLKVCLRFFLQNQKRAKGLEFFIHIKLELRQNLFIPELS